jgi:dTDP-4-dehydrorhamnose 3,5-epimerase
LRPLGDRAQGAHEERDAGEEPDELRRPDRNVQELGKRDCRECRDDHIEQSEARKPVGDAFGQSAKVPVVVQRAKLGGKLRHDRSNEGAGERGDERGVDKRVESAVRGDAELAACHGMRDETAEIEHHAGAKNEQALLEHRAGAQTLEPTPERERAGRTHTAVHSTFVLMQIEQLPLGGALMLAPRIVRDSRGFFEETYSLDRYRSCGIKETFVQDNLSLSHRDVLRGLHGAVGTSKLVAVVRGSVFDVIVDVRPESPTYGRWFGDTLSAESGRQIYVPAGFLHGFLALEDRTLFAYKQSVAYDPAIEFSVAWDDATLGIDWPLAGRRPALSLRDASNPPLASLVTNPNRAR